MLSDTRPAKNITCGGNDGRTDMSQFSLLNKIGYTEYAKYCLQTLPVCACQNGSSATQCCNGINPQLYVGGVPQTVLNTGPAESVYGIKLGYVLVCD